MSLLLFFLFSNIVFLAIAFSLKNFSFSSSRISFSKNQYKGSSEYTDFVSIFKRKRGRTRIIYSESLKSALLSHSLRRFFICGLLNGSFRLPWAVVYCELVLQHSEGVFDPSVRSHYQTVD